MRTLLANLFWQHNNRPLTFDEIGRKMPGDGRVPMFEKVSGKPINKMSDAEIHRARAGVQKMFTEMGRTQFVKTHSAYCQEADSWHILPKYTEGAILVVRDPRDVVLSITNHFDKTPDEAVEMINERNTALTSDGVNKVWSRIFDWSSHYLSWTDILKERCFLIRYEDLHMAPEATLESVCHWAGIPIDTHKINMAVGHSAFENLQQAEKTNGFREASSKGSTFFHTGRKGRWRTELRPDLIAAVERRHGRVMRRLGYELTTS